MKNLVFFYIFLMPIVAHAQHISSWQETRHPMDMSQSIGAIAVRGQKVEISDGASPSQMLMPPTRNRLTMATGMDTPSTCQNIVACAVSSLISYSPGWAKSVEHTFLAHLENAVSATDFGADATGATDASAAINSALATSRHVILPCGTYSLQATIILSASRRLEGGGSCTVLRLDNGNAVGVQAIGANAAELTKVSITKTADRKADDILFNAVTDGKIENIIDSDTGHAAYTGLHLTGVTHVSVSHSRFITDSIAGYGIQIDGITAPSSNIILSDTNVSGFLDGLEVNYVSGLFVDNVRVSSGFEAGILIQPDTADVVSRGTLIAETASDLRFTRVFSVGNIGDGWETAGDGVIHGLYLTNCTGVANGLIAGDQSYSANGFHQGNMNAVGIAITNSDFSLNYGNGVYVEGGSAITLAGNRIGNNSLTEFNGSNGVTVMDQTSNFTLTDNVIGYSPYYGNVKNQSWGAYILAVDGIAVSGNIFRKNNKGGIHITQSIKKYPYITNVDNMTD